MNKLLIVLGALALGGGAFWYYKKNNSSAANGGAIDFIGDLMSGTTRGLRNNNPGNIKWNSVNKWTGQTGSDDGGFAVFSAPEFGIRAMNKTLNTYDITGRDTIEKIIKSWTAGDASNIQNNYMLKLEQLTGKARTVALAPADRINVIKGIILFENANQNPFTDAFIKNAMAIV